MQCSCGGVTQDKQVVKDKEVVTEYKECTSCGRVIITYTKEKTDE